MKTLSTYQTEPEVVARELRRPDVSHPRVETGSISSRTLQLNLLGDKLTIEGGWTSR
jgi:hypothetical protein